MNEKTVRRHWEVARVRLYQLISTTSGGADAGWSAPDPIRKNQVAEVEARAERDAASLEAIL